MAIDLLKTVQENLGYPPLQKVDPNTQKIKTDTDSKEPGRLIQGTLPASLIALYKYSRQEEGAEAILHAGPDIDWTNFIFGANREEAIGKMVAYSGNKSGEVVNSINKITHEAVRVIREQVTPDTSLLEIKNILAGARNTILHYLPADLQIGKVLNDNTLDDRTHKMEGPVSSLMHAIGGSFSGSDSDETTISK